MTLSSVASSICYPSPGVNVINDFAFSSAKQNEALLFIKPEVFLGNNKNHLARVDLILSKLTEFRVEIHGIVSFDGKTLAEKAIMDRHYGYINRLSRNASTALSSADRQTVLSTVSAGADSEILGGHEVLERHPMLDSRSLDNIWATKKSAKIRSGLYVESYTIEDQDLVIVNGFHPFQLEHFTAPDRRIVLFVVRSDLPWSRLRASMLGDTFPERADRNSIRGMFNEDPKSYGFENVTIANNCVHMSAGPFEAAFEFKNFLGDQPNFSRRFQECSLATRAVKNSIELELLQNCIANGGEIDENLGIGVSLFDATEECDTYSSMEVLRQSLIS